MLFQGFGRWIHQILGITMQNSCMHYNMYVGDMLIHHTTTALSLRTDSGRQDTAMRQIYLQHATAILCVCVCELFGWLRMPQTKQKTEWMNHRRRSSLNVWVNIKFIYKLMQLRASHNALRCATPARLGWVQVSDENIRTVNSAGEWWATHTHDSHIAFQFLFFFGSFVSVYHAAHTKAHRAYIGIIQPQHGLSLPCLNMLHHICHLSYTTYGRRRQKKKNYPSFELIYAINRDELMKSTSQTRKVYIPVDTEIGYAPHIWHCSRRQAHTLNFRPHTHNAPENRFIHAAAVTFLYFSARHRLAPSMMYLHGCSSNTKDQIFFVDVFFVVFILVYYSVAPGFVCYLNRQISPDESLFVCISICLFQCR